MSNLENKEKNLNSLIKKLSNLSNSYSHDELKTEELKKERVPIFQLCRLSMESNEL